MPGSVCRWCYGQGSVTKALAYVPGPNPFQGRTETVMRLAECRHCRGTGVYDSDLDPTLERWRSDPPAES